MNIHSPNYFFDLEFIVELYESSYQWLGKDLEAVAEH